MRFPEEQQTLSNLLDEWYTAIKEFTEKCNGIFTAKAKQYDQASPVWHRIEWPYGFAGELRKKNDRIAQMLTNYDPKDPVGSVNWNEINEELGDVVNYARMMGGINHMVMERNGTVQSKD